MKLKVNNVYCEVLAATQEEHAALSRELSVRVQGYQYTHAYTRGRWDGMKRFYHRGYGTFLTGFLPLVCGLWGESHFTMTIEDKRYQLTNYTPGYSEIGLREYQAEELAKVICSKLYITPISENAVTSIPWIRGIVKHPTGSGKTFFAGGVIQSLQFTTLYIVEKLDLLYQTQEFLSDFLHTKVGVIGDTHADLQKYTIGTIQTLRSRFDSLRSYFDRVRVLLFDECHHVSDSAYHSVATACRKAPYRFGFSGTPLSRNDIGDVYLVGDTGAIISEIDRNALEVQGYLATPTLYVFSVDDTPMHLSYQAAYRRLITESSHRNGLIGDIVQVCAQRNMKVLVLVRHINHGKTLHNLFNLLGMKNRFLQGKDAVEKRRKTLKQLGTNGRNVIIATSIFDEGVDAPEIDCVVMAGGGASKIKSIQRVGRGLRPKKDGTNTLTVIDFDDNSNKYLSAHTYDRLTAYQQEGFKIDTGVNREKFIKEISR